MNFTNYAAQEGLHLLKDDINYIRKEVKPLPKDLRKATMLAYIECWLKAMAQEPVEHKRQSKGRYAANSWLLNHKPHGKTCL